MFVSLQLEMFTGYQVVKTIALVYMTQGHITFLRPAIPWKSTLKRPEKKQKKLAKESVPLPPQTFQQEHET